jgi:hypothetical protein
MCFYSTRKKVGIVQEDENVKFSNQESHDDRHSDRSSLSPKKFLTGKFQRADDGHEEDGMRRRDLGST